MKEKSIRRNFIMNALLAVSSLIFPLISFRYASRILMPDGIGKVSFVTSVTAYFSMFAQLGIPTYGIRACAKVRDDRKALSITVHELLGINLVMDFISYALLSIAVLCIPKLWEARLLFVIISSTILLNSIGMEWLYKGLEEYTYITVRSMAFKVIALIALFFLVRQKSDYVIYGCITIFAASASNLLNFFHARRYVDIRGVHDCQWKRHLKPVLIFFGMACATTIYTNLDSVMLGFMTTDTDVGYYNAAIKVKTVLVGLITALGAVLLPRSAYYVERGQLKDFRRISHKAFSFILVCAPPIAVYFFFYAQESIQLLSGDIFLPSVVPMQVLVPTIFLIGITNILGIQTLVPLGKEKTVLQSEIAGAIVDLILNFILIPHFQATGAAIGTLTAEAVVLAIQYNELKTELKAFVSAYRWKRLVAGLIIGLAAAIWVKALQLRPVFSLLISGTLFFGAYISFLFWQKEEIITGVVEQVWRKNSRHKDINS